ncbi:MAG: intermembrane phospholipid transport protein YdbH family protein [Woeseiaceae bacterium]
MKFTKYVVIAAGIVAALATIATIAWFLRDHLIQRISNPLLADYGIRVADVSLDALATDDASIGYLELVHEKGTTIAIEDLTLPFATSSNEAKSYKARKVSIVTATRTDGEAFEIAELLRQIISLPDRLDNTVLIIDEFDFSPYPTVQNVRWKLTDRRQQLDVSVQSVEMSVTLTLGASNEHDIALTLSSSHATSGGNILAARLLDETEQLTLTGTNPIDLPTWQPLSSLAGIIPARVELASGKADLAFDVVIPSDAAHTPTLTASLSPTSAVKFDYRNESDDVASIIATSTDSADISATFPKVDWSLRLAEGSLTVDYGDWTNVPLSVKDLTCTLGPTCSMSSQIAIDARRLPVGKVARADISSKQELRFTDVGLHIDIRAGATLKVNELETEAGGIERLQAELVSGAEFHFGDTGWLVSSDSVDVEVENLSIGNDVSLSMPLFIENANASHESAGLSLGAGIYAPSVRTAWSEKTIVLPGIKGRVTLNDDDVAADLETVGLHQEATIRAEHKLADGTGNLSVNEAIVSFGKTNLADRLSPWPDDRDIVTGTTSLDFSADWVRKNSHLAYSAQASIVATDLAGYYGDTAFTDLSTRFDTRYQDEFGFKSEASTITAALVEVGIPVEDLSAGYALDLNTLSAAINNLSMSAFGGVIAADPFSFYTDRAINTLTLTADSLDLTELLSLKGFEAVDVAGSVGAKLPLTIAGDSVTIVDGVLTGNPPGGVIRYISDSPPDDTDASSLGFAKRVLSNFEFDSLTSDVNLNNEGDLTLKLQLTGRNPDLDETRPVVLNLGVENNIPQMLRSLRAARAVEDVLERRLNR